MEVQARKTIGNAIDKVNILPLASKLLAVFGPTQHAYIRYIRSFSTVAQLDLALIYMAK